MAVCPASLLALVLCSLLHPTVGKRPEVGLCQALNITPTAVCYDPVGLPYEKSFFFIEAVNKLGELYFSHVLGSYGYEYARSRTDNNLVYKFMPTRMAETPTWQTESQQGNYTINHTPFDMLLGSKVALLYLFKQIGRNCNYQNMHPESFWPSLTEDCEELKKRLEQSPNSLWFSKYPLGTGGKGIEILHARQLQQDPKLCTGEQIVQRNVDPLLLDSRVFTLRTAIVVVSFDPYIVFFRPGYKQKSLTPYRSGTRQELITNWQLQQFVPGFKISDWFSDFPKFQSEILEEGIMTEAEFGIFLDSLKRLAFHLMKAARPIFKKTQNAWSWFSMDVIVDKSMNPKILELNTNTNVAQTPYMLPWHWKFFHELVYLVDSFYSTGGKNFNSRRATPNSDWHLLIDESVTPTFELVKEKCYENPFPKLKKMSKKIKV